MSNRFKRPNVKARLRAAKVNAHETNTPKCFCAVPEGAFCPIARPRSSDWLASHDEDWRGQNVTQFLRVSFVALPHAHVDTIELIPVGPVNNKLLDYLSQWQAVFYGCKCQIGKPIRIRDVSESMRAGAMGQLQLKCSDIYEKLRTRKSARNILVRVAVTMADLYPDEDWNFVYGEAVPMQGYGVFSFSRYFGDDETDFPINYDSPGCLDKINGDTLLPGMHKTEAQPSAQDTPQAMLYEGARLYAIAEGQEEQHEEKDALDRKTSADEESNEADSTRTKKKRKKKSKKKRPRNAKHKPATAATATATAVPSPTEQADEMASAIEAPGFSNAIQNAMRKSLGAMTASLTSWQQEFADVDKLLANTMSLINKSREKRGDTALDIKPTGDTSKSEASQPPVILTPEKSADPNIPASPSDPFALFLYRCAKVLTHETGHLFGIRHCIHYECLMCGCNHREEFDRRPTHLCPVCLRKLCIRREKPHTIDPVARYKAMARLAHKFGWADEVAWLHRRIEAIAEDASAPSAAAPELETVSAAQLQRQRRTVVTRPPHRLCPDASTRTDTNTNTKIVAPPPSVQLARQRSLERRLAQERKTHATTSGLEFKINATKKTASRSRTRRTVVRKIKAAMAKNGNRTNRARESKPRARRTVVRKPRRGKQVTPPDQDPVPPPPSSRVHLARQRSWDRREEERRAIARVKEEMETNMFSKTNYGHVNDVVSTKGVIFFYDEPYQIVD